MGKIFEINKGSPNMQDNITPNAVLQGIKDHQSLFQTKFPHDTKTFFYINFILHYYTLFLVFFEGVENAAHEICFIYSWYFRCCSGQCFDGRQLIIDSESIVQASGCSILLKYPYSQFLTIHALPNCICHCTKMLLEKILYYQFPFFLSIW